jgi:hypothetical protein
LSWPHPAHDCAHFLARGGHPTHDRAPWCKIVPFQPEENP